MSNVGRPSTVNDPSLLPSYVALQIAIGGAVLPCRRGMIEWMSDDPDEQMKAAARCSSCVALNACRRFALEADERYGVWGGLTARQRMRLRRAAA